MAGQIWATDSLGGFMYNDELSRTLRYKVQPLVKFRQFCDARDGAAKAKHKGQLYTWDVYSDVVTAGTTLVETNTMPETNFTIKQGTLTVDEMGNSVPFTAKLDVLAEHPVREVINKVMKNDAKKAFDRAAHAQFNRTALRVVPTGGTDTAALTLTTNGTATLTNNLGLGKEHVKTIVDLLKERNVPPYESDDYFAIGRPASFRRLKNDLESIHQYVESGATMIYNGEIGRYEGVRFIEQTNILQGVAFGGTQWSNAKSDGIYFFGDDTVTEAIVVPEEIRGKIPSNDNARQALAA